MADMPVWLADEVETARAERAEALERLGLQDTAATPGARDRVNEAVDATIDGWMAKGDVAKATSFYERSLALRPGNKHAKDMIKKMRESKP